MDAEQCGGFGDGDIGQMAAAMGWRVGWGLYSAGYVGVVDVPAGGKHGNDQYPVFGADWIESIDNRIFTGSDEFSVNRSALNSRAKIVELGQQESHGIEFCTNAAANGYTKLPPTIAHDVADVLNRRLRVNDLQCLSFHLRPDAGRALQR